MSEAIAVCTKYYKLNDMSFIKILGIVLFNALLIYAVYSRFENTYKVYKKERRIHVFDILWAVIILCLSFLLYYFYLYDWLFA